MSRVGQTVVPGHGLRFEGRAHLARGCCAADGNHGMLAPLGDRNGHGFCACGESSPCLASNTERKQWHREHKAAVLLSLTLA